MKKIGIILGTRPEIIKCSSIIRILQNQDKISYFIIHTNQHYSENMDKVFFSDLKLDEPKYNLGINGGFHGEMTGRMMIEIEKILLEENPDTILVQGDTNTVLAGGLVASKIGIKVGHIEAGLRSYDKTMPEEINRIVTDNVSDFCFCPTQIPFDNLKNEGFSDEKICITGNTIVDAVLEGVKIGLSSEKSLLDSLAINIDEYILFTTHRPSNVDNKDSLKSLLEGVNELYKISNKKILFPIHPRTKANIKRFNLDYLIKEFIVIEPIGFINNLIVEKNAFFIITDSGGMQEEGCILKKKTLVLRKNTERPETLEVGGAILVGSDKEKIINSFNELKDKTIDWYNPFGDGLSGQKILNLIT